MKKVLHYQPLFLILISGHDTALVLGSSLEMGSLNLSILEKLGDSSTKIVPDGDGTRTCKQEHRNGSVLLFGVRKFWKCMFTGVLKVLKVLSSVYRDVYG